MAHFARLDENDIVVGVHVVSDDVITVDSQEVEQLGIDFLSELHNHPYWAQTSYNGNIRKNYAGVGMKFDRVRNAFIAPKPFESWILNEETCGWEPPTPKPTGMGHYAWSEADLNWQEI